MNPTLTAAQNANVAQENSAGQQAASYQPQVSQDIAGTNAAQQNLQSAQQQYAQPQNDLGNIYNQNLQSSNQYYGVNPQAIQQQAQAIAQTQTMMAGLPQALAQRAGGGMVTAAQAAGGYGQALAPLQTNLASQGNTLAAMQQGENVAQTAANQQTGYTGQTQAQNLGALQNLYQDAIGKQTQAQAQVQYFSTLQQQGYNVTAQLEGAQAALNQAQASFAQAAATVQAASIAAAPANTQNAMAQQASILNAQKIANQANAQQPGLGNRPGVTAASQQITPAPMPKGPLNPFGVGTPGGLLGFL